MLTKLDGDARGGAALSVRSITGRPVMFASNGERIEDFDAFHPERMASRILGMGDMLTLIEQAERAFDADQAEQMAAKLQQGTAFGLDDFLSQLQAVRKMGPLNKLFGMLPGASQFREALDNFDEREVDRVEAIIRSMTPTERSDPKILNGSRRTRIADGSGTSVADVNQLVERFYVARDMMTQAARGGGVPAMPGMPGASGKKSKGRMQQPAKTKSKGKGGGRGARSGNPAKRAAQQAEAELRRQAGPAGEPDLELPAEFRDLLPPSR